MSERLARYTSELLEHRGALLESRGALAHRHQPACEGPHHELVAPLEVGGERIPEIGIPGAAARKGAGSLQGAAVQLPDRGPIAGFEAADPELVGRMASSPPGNGIPPRSATRCR